MLKNFLLPSLSSVNPDNYALEIFFFILIWSLFLIGLSLIYLLYNKQKKSISSRKGLVNGNLLVHKNVDDILEATTTRKEVFLFLLPGTLLILGLLGTFIGIGLAITKVEGAFQLNNDDVDSMIQSITPILNSIGVQFKTSIWGIIGSVVLKNIASVFDPRQQRAKYILSSIARKEQTNINNNKAKWLHIERSIDDIKTNLILIKEYTGSFSKDINGLRTSLQDAINKFVSTANFFAEKVDQFNLTVNNFDQTVTQFRNEVEKILGKLDETLDEMQQSLKDEIKNLNKEVKTTFEQFSKNINESLSRMEISLSNASSEIGIATKDLKYEVINLSTSMVERLNDIKGYSKTLSAAQRQISTSQAKYVLIMEGINSFVEMSGERTHKLIEALNVFLKEDGVIANKLNTILSILDENKDISERIKKIEECTSLFLNKIDDANVRISDESVNFFVMQLKEIIDDKND